MTDQASITPEERKALVEAAEKATRGPWETERSVIHGRDYGLRGIIPTPDEPTEDDDGQRVMRRTGSGGAVSYSDYLLVPHGVDADEENFAYIALANPSTILRLEAALTAAEARATKAEGEREALHAAAAEVQRLLVEAESVDRRKAVPSPRWVEGYQVARAQLARALDQSSSPTEGGEEGGIASRIPQNHQCADAGSLPALAGWQPIETAPCTDDERQPHILVYQAGRRFIAQWDPCAGQFQGVTALDGLEREQFYQEWPGRLYAASHWMPIPEAPDGGEAVHGQAESDKSRDALTPSTTPDTSTGEDND